MFCILMLFSSLVCVAALIHWSFMNGNISVCHALVRDSPKNTHTDASGHVGGYCLSIYCI